MKQSIRSIVGQGMRARKHKTQNQKNITQELLCEIFKSSHYVLESIMSDPMTVINKSAILIYSNYALPWKYR